MSFVAFMQGLFALFTGPLGLAAIGLLLVWGLFESAAHKRPGPFMWALVSGGLFYSLSWIMSAVLAGGGGGGI